MHTEVIQIKNTLGLKVVASKQLNTNEFISVLLQCLDNNEALFFTCNFIVADFSHVTSFDLPINELINISKKSHQQENKNSNSIILSIATKNNELYKLLTNWKEILSGSEFLQSGVFRDVERATQWVDIKITQS